MWEALRPNVNAARENGTFSIFFAKLCTLCTFCGKFPISVVKSYFVEKYTAFRLMEQHVEPNHIPAKRKAKKRGEKTRNEGEYEGCDACRQAVGKNGSCLQFTPPPFHHV